MFFAIKEFLYIIYKNLNDICLSIYDNRNQAFYHKFINKRMMSICNQQRLMFFCSSIKLIFSFYMASTDHDGSFFNTYVSNNWVFFNISFHTEKFVFTNYTLPFWSFFHINNLPIYLNARKVCIFLYDKVKGKGGYKKFLFFSRIFVHNYEITNLFRIKDLKISYNSNNI